MLRKTDLDMVKRRARVLLNCKPKFSKDSHFVIHPFFGIDCFVEDGKNVLSIRDEKQFKKVVNIYENYIDKIAEYNDFSVILNNKSQIPLFFKETVEYLDKYDFNRFLSHMWVMVEFPNYNEFISPKQFIQYFKKTDKNLLMDKEELKIYNNLLDEIEIYRGVSYKWRENGTKALSWTINRDKAKWFATRYEFKGLVYTAKVKKEDVFSYFNSRNEDELVVDYNKIELLSIEEIYSESTTNG